MRLFSRRAFIGGLGAAAGATLLGRAGRVRAQPQAGRVVCVTDGSAWSGPGWADADLDAGVLRSMLERCLIALTGLGDARSALGALIPNLGQGGQRIGIKVNCVNADLPTHPGVVDVLARLLVEAGARAEDLVVFDRSDAELAKCGYAQGDGPGPLVYGTSRAGVLFAEQGFSLSDAEIRLSRIVAESVDHLISVPVLKHHEMAGVTLSLKNHFGSIDRPSALHGRANDCSPGIAELCALPVIRDRTRLVLIDATFGSYKSGLGGKPDFAPMTLIAAVDPVAADAVGQDVINARREMAGLPLLDARHLRDAAALGLGNGDLATVERRNILVSPGPAREPPWANGGNGCAWSPGTIGAGVAVAAAGVATIVRSLARRR